MVALVLLPIVFSRCCLQLKNASVVFSVPLKAPTFVCAFQWEFCLCLCHCLRQLLLCNYAFVSHYLHHSRGRLPQGYFFFLGEKQKAVMKCAFLGMMCLPSTLSCGANPRHFNIHKQRGRTLTVDLEDKPLIAPIYLAMPIHMLTFWAGSLLNVHLAAGL